MGSKQYTREYKIEAVKLGKGVGVKQASGELDIPLGTLYGWMKKEKTGDIDLGPGSRTPSNLKTLAAENKALREKIRAIEKENAKITKTNEFLEEARRFFVQIWQN